MAFKCSEFLIGYPDQYTLDEGQRIQQPKCCDNHKDRNSSLNVNSVNNNKDN